MNPLAPIVAITTAVTAVMLRKIADGLDSPMHHDLDVPMPMPVTITTIDAHLIGCPTVGLGIAIGPDATTLFYMEDK